jgi:hypothetical protein
VTGPPQAAFEAGTRNSVSAAAPRMAVNDLKELNDLNERFIMIFSFAGVASSE